MNAGFFQTVGLTIFYGCLGIVLLIVGFWAVDRVIPTHIWNGIVEEKNVALAIVVAAFVLAVGMIVAGVVR